jgi:dihydroorotate dehydrogenase (fumarate)
MNTSSETKYMGINLKNPLIISSCSLTGDLDKVKQMEDYGAAAIVLPSLFEEALTYDKEYIENFTNSFQGFTPEAFDYLPVPDHYNNLEGEEYIENLRRIKKSVGIPVFGSLNGVGIGGWTKYSKMMEDAGADGIELNIFYIPTDTALSANEIENRYIEVLQKVKDEVNIPVAVKLNPFFSSLANMATKLDNAGADGLVLFNRFLEPDINLETFEIDPKLEFSSRFEMRLPLHWTAILHNRVKASLCAGRGVKSGEQMIKLIMAGADTVSISSVLYQQSISSIKVILQEANKWMVENEFDSFKQMRGSMSYKKIADPSHLERLNYMKTLKAFL